MVPRYVKRVLTWLGSGVDVVGAHVNYKIADSYGRRVLALPGGIGWIVGAESLPCGLPGMGRAGGRSV